MTIKEWQQRLFWILVVLLPVQIGKHFWPDWSYINGLRIDYFSPTLFLTDILIVGLFLLEIIENFRKHGTLTRRGWLVVGTLAALALTNSIFSLSPPLSAYKWIKVFEFSWLGYWIYKNVRLTKLILGLILIPIAYEAFLATWQFVSGSSAGGWWYFLGERAFNSGTPGIANTVISNELVLRPYGTFSHPNVLAGFLAIGGLLVGAKIAWGKCGKRAYLGHYFLQKRVILAGILSVGYGALLLTLSRTAIMITTGLTILYLLPYFRGWWRFIVITLGIIGLGLISKGLWEAREAESGYVRIQQYEQAVARIGQTPLLGTGLGTSPLYKYEVASPAIQAQNYALSHQPVHNLYLLVLAETGVLGLIPIGGFGAVLYLAWRTRSRLVFPLAAIALIGIVDHYFLTLQQGQLLLAIILGLALSELKKKDFGYT